MDTLDMLITGINLVTIAILITTIAMLVKNKFVE